MKEYITYLKFNTETKEELIDLIKNDIVNDKKSFVVTPNLDFLRISYTDIEFRNLVNSSDYSLVDGAPILWFTKNKKISKISGSDFVFDILKLANDNAYSILLFGGKEGVAERASNNIKCRYSGISKVFTYSPKFGYEKNDDEIEKCVAYINNSKADIVLLCTGTPKTEKFYYLNKDKFGNAVYLSVGATIDFLAGSIKRAPKWMSNIGLEWLYRLSKDFKRLFKRYWLDFWFLCKLIFIVIFNKKKINKLKGEK